MHIVKLIPLTANQKITSKRVTRKKKKNKGESNTNDGIDVSDDDSL